MPKTSKTYYEIEIDRLFNEVLFRPEQYLQIRQSKVFMDEFYAEDITLNDLAAAALMSRFHFVRVFQKMYGLTPRNYLRDIRIAKAKQLLNLQLPITQVCLDVGYQSLPTFSAVFKKCTGYSPRAFQKAHRELNSIKAT